MCWQVIHAYADDVVPESTRISDPQTLENFDSDFGTLFKELKFGGSLSLRLEEKTRSYSLNFNKFLYKYIRVIIPFTYF